MENEREIFRICNPVKRVKPAKRRAERFFREEARKIIEKTTKTIKKSLYFEESGETLSVEISLENVSPCVKTDTIIAFLNTLFENAKEAIS